MLNIEQEISLLRVCLEEQAVEYEQKVEQIVELEATIYNLTRLVSKSAVNESHAIEQLDNIPKWVQKIFK